MRACAYTRYIVSNSCRRVFCENRPDINNAVGRHHHADLAGSVSFPNNSQSLAGVRFSRVDVDHFFLLGRKPIRTRTWRSKLWGVNMYYKLYVWYKITSVQERVGTYTPTIIIGPLYKANLHTRLLFIFLFSFSVTFSKLFRK